jgi:indolepyruvate ferredoxin oxidoreductase beta subunit
MEELKIILVGLGGQGVVFFTRLLSHTAMTLGYPVMVSETHGMSQRGGSVVSHLKIGGSQAPLIRRGTADILLALEPDEAIRNLTFLRKGGTAFVNTENGLRPEVTEHLERLDINICTLPASQMAMELGSAAVTNVILAGFAAAHPALPLPFEALQETVQSLAPRGQALNLKALGMGFQAGQSNSEPLLNTAAKQPVVESSKIQNRK